MDRKSEIRNPKSETNPKFKIQISKTDLLMGIVVVGVFLGLRLVNLTELPVFADEAIYVRWAQVMRAESTLRFLPLSDGKQPLYMWLVIPFLKVFSDPLVAGRLVSVGAGLGALVGIWLLTWRLTRSKLSAWGAGFLWAVVPYAVFFERMALVDSLLTMFFVWALLLGVLAMQLKRWDLGMLTGFALGGALLTKTPGVWLCGLLPMGVILSEKRKAKSEKLFNVGNLMVVVKGWMGRWVYLVPAYVIGGGLYNILRLGPEFHMLAIRNRDYVHPWGEVLAHPLNPMVSHLRDIVGYFWLMGTPGVFVLGVIGLIWVIKEKRLGILGWLGMWLVIPLVIQAGISRTMTARYLLFLLPVVVIWAGVGFDWLWRWSRERFNWGSWGVWGTLGLGSEGWFGTPLNGLEMYLNQVSGVTVIGVGYPILNVSEKLTNATVDNEVSLVVNKSRFKIDDPGSAGLELVAEYHKAERVDGERGSLMVWEVRGQGGKGGDGV
jgi:4-amino-4-deoxy-L-arabinose transferase-like glycosyltransferase